MCGIAGLVGGTWTEAQLRSMVTSQHHRGPDDEGIYLDQRISVGLGHTRLSVLDLSKAGHQPMSDPENRFWIVFNGEIYNYLELKTELKDYPYRSQTDTEVILAAYQKWGEACLDRLVGMFAFAIWDTKAQKLFCARDRFGIKPFFYHQPTNDTLWFASEIKALHAAGVDANPDEGSWATYLSMGFYNHDEKTFWKNIFRLLPGHSLTWSKDQGIQIKKWYDIADRVLDLGEDVREEKEVLEELAYLLKESIKLRFRSDVELGVCLSGGLDSSLLIGLIEAVYGRETSLKTFTFYSQDKNYDERPWARRVLEGTNHTPIDCELTAKEVPDLVKKVQANQDEPFGGFPILGMAKVHARAKKEGVTVLLDGNGLDEGWGGYDYYTNSDQVDFSKGLIQGTKNLFSMTDYLTKEFLKYTHPFKPDLKFKDTLRKLQYRDIRYTKITRAMRFADRISMMYSRELREPFLDHRIMELGLRQKQANKIRNGQSKWLLRQVAKKTSIHAISDIQKRPVQTPQREWLRGCLKDWAHQWIDSALSSPAREWLKAAEVKKTWQDFQDGKGDNSFHVWQWISLGHMMESIKQYG